ncbi:hypothetical protein [Cytobacillus sp.]|uniref:hypothetical protein n=1 Tax=Cytobacillus sp. TaxID=2675269 RepID=UPI003516E625
MIDFPIDPEFLKKRKAIPEKIAELSYKNEQEAIKYMRIWGEKAMPITELFDELVVALSEEAG